MELWIRSQDRETLRLAETLDIYELGDDKEKRFVIEESGVDIGCYKSKERALEVLDEIQQFINNGGCSIITQDEQSISLNAYIVYQMPKD